MAACGVHSTVTGADSLEENAEVNCQVPDTDLSLQRTHAVIDGTSEVPKPFWWRALDAELKKDKKQQPWPTKRQCGIRGHGHDSMDSRTCANTNLKKTGPCLQHSSLVWPKHQHHARTEMQKSCRWLLQSHDSERTNVASAAHSRA